MKNELNQTWMVNDDEIALFRKMKDILSRTYLVDFIEETHMHYVTFDSNTINQKVRKEISDLWIIAFSPKKNKARMTFLQAKYERKNDLSIIPRFSGDYFQYELLSTRPQINNVGRRFKLPQNVLSFSCCSSVGSYGVFFLDSSNKIDLAYFTANHLKILSQLPTSTVSCNVNFQIPTPLLTRRKCNCNICNEMTHCFDIDSFTSGITNLEIGAELTADSNMLDQIKQILIPYQNNNLTISQFINLGGTSPNNDTSDDNSENDSINLLIINTDENTRH